MMATSQPKLVAATYNCYSKVVHLRAVFLTLLYMLYVVRQNNETINCSFTDIILA
jgi:hypothetical protein